MANKGIDFVLSLQTTRFQSALNGVTSRVRQASGAVGKYWQSTETGARKAGDAFVGLRTKVAGAVAAIGGTPRPGQQEMTAEVTRTIETGEHLLVQAGTGTGKSLAYLVPAVLSGRRTVVATATKALQDQLAEVDLPFLATALNRKVRFAVLKGRSNYACLQRVDEVTEQLAQGSLELDDGADDPQAELARLVEWAETSSVGDKAELERDPSVAAWSAVSVGPRECPGASNCARGEDCFAEALFTGDVGRLAFRENDFGEPGLAVVVVHLAAVGRIDPAVAVR